MPALQSYPVEGMTCAACARRVERALTAVPGVRSARVDAAIEQAQVDAPEVPTTTLAAAVEAAGYHLIITAAGSTAPAQTPEPLWPVVVALAATLPLMLPMLGIPLHLPWPVQAALAAGVVFGFGGGFLRRAATLALRGETSMDTLIALGAVLGLGLGVWEAVRGSPHPPFEISASLVAFLRLGRWIEAKARHRATGSVRDLLTHAPTQAERVNADGSAETVAVSVLAPGDRVRIRPGSAVPVDGTIIDGAADVEESVITGEPLPVARSIGGKLLAGSVVHGGSVIVQVSAAGAGTWLADLAAQVSAATASRPPAQVLADRISAVFVPAILAVAAATFVGWWLQGDAGHAARIAITVLVVACPCALGLATPVAMAVALGSAARQGVLVRDQRALDQLGRVTDLVLDKTGTLTQGRPMVTEVRTLADLDESRLRAIAAALERGSEHPLARALRSDDRGLAVADWRAVPAGGVEGTIDSQRYRLGSLTWTGIADAQVPADATAIGLTRDGQAVGLMLLTDPVRPETSAVLAEAGQRGLRLHLLSGDRPAAVARFAANLPLAAGLASFAGGVDPAGKAARIRALQAEGRVVAFAGDGINDATALATADAGISLPGLDATAAAAGLNLRREGLRPLLDLHDLARRLRRIIAQNLAWAFGYNAVLVPIAALGWLDHLGGPVVAGAAMALSSLTVVLNALRLRSARDATTATGKRV